MSGQPLVVHLHDAAEAACVAEALGSDVVRIVDDAGTWHVHVELGSRSLDALLTALHRCLLENDIGRVRVTLDGKTYPMAATPVA